MTSYELDGRRSIPDGGIGFFLYSLRPAGSRAHPASRKMGTGTSFPGNKVRPGRDADHSPPSSAEIKKERGYTSSHPQAPLMASSGSILLY
jgi:hypothetical protein